MTTTAPRAARFVLVLVAALTALITLPTAASITVPRLSAWRVPVVARVRVLVAQLVAAARASRAPPAVSA